MTKQDECGPTNVVLVTQYNLKRDPTMFVADLLSLFDKRKQLNKGRTTSIRHCGVRNGIEPLEDRRMLATTFELASLLPENGGDGTEGFSLNSDSSSLSVGDVNGDSIDDMVAFAPYAQSGKGGNKSYGAAYVVFGDAKGFPALVDVDSLDGSNGFVIWGDPSDTARGASFSSRGAVSIVGDLNGDDVNDVVLGWDQAEPDRAGKAYVVFGRHTDEQGEFPASFNVESLDGQNGFVIHGATPYIQAGFAISSGGDINNDGLDDLFLGAPRADVSGNLEAGETYVVYGRDYNSPGTIPFDASFSLSTLDGSNGFTIEGIATGDRSGQRVEVSGDINGDGIVDLMISARTADADPARAESGQVYVVFGRDGSIESSVFPKVVQLSGLLPGNGGDGSAGFVINGVAQNDHLYWSSAGGDLNDDGIHDLALAATGADVDGETDAGEAYVLFGRQSYEPVVELGALRSADGRDGFIIEGTSEGNFTGTSLVLGGDVNGDGHDDLAFAAPWADTDQGPEGGEVYVIYGKAADPTGPSSPPFDAVLNLNSLSGSQGMKLLGESGGRAGVNALMSGPLFSSGSGVAMGDINADGTQDLLIGVGADSRVVFGKNFAQAGITVAPTENLLTNENGGSAAFDIVLDTQPMALVTIDVSSTDATEGTIVGATAGVLTLTFDATNWDVPQTVTVQGVDDLVADGDQPYTIQLAPAVSVDAAYSGLDAKDVWVTNLDNDAPPASANDIYVWDIDLQTRKRRGSNEGRIFIDIRNDWNANGVDSFDTGAQNVLVSVTLTCLSETTIFSGYTDSNGVFRSGWISGLAPGDYTIEVIDLAHATLNWNMLLDVEDDWDGDGLPDDVFALL
jgi:hypothetical protein